MCDAIAGAMMHAGARPFLVRLFAPAQFAARETGTNRLYPRLPNEHKP
ncbi:hypothetical protein HT746_02465 [Burkholderia pyrrocinia]|nr:hypothetical protein [Burkholderia pyrrocinia]NTX26017.1 hypothetical protein [Burkholderia pyrrocinia]